MRGMGSRTSSTCINGFDHTDATELFTSSAPFLFNLVAYQDHGEDRWKGIGMLRRVIVVFFTN